MRVSSWLVTCLLASIFLSLETPGTRAAQVVPPAPLAPVSQPTQSAPPADVQKLLQQSVNKLYEAPEQVIELSQKIADLAYKSSNSGAYAEIGRASCRERG